MTVAWLFILFSFLILAVRVCCQTGFISIDCGIAEDSNYTDGTNKIFYTSDAKFIDTGANSLITNEYTSDKVSRRYQTLRSFPDGTRNCYTLTPVVKSNRYLIRASFKYGNYDGLDKPPRFSVSVDANPWDVELPTSEIITFATRDYISVCLENTGLGTPYISSLESRLLDNSTYQGANQTHFLSLHTRILYSGGDTIRYPEDVYDRTWNAWLGSSRWTVISNSSINPREDLGYQLPLLAMKFAIMPSNRSWNFSFNTPYYGPTFQYHVFLHFTELEQLQPNQSREFTISVDGVNQYGPFSPKYLSVDTVQIFVSNFNGRGFHTVQLNRTRASTLPPILNAYEIYIIKRLSSSPTNDQDVKAMIDIKATYKVKRNWIGDPCLPVDYLWEGLTCTDSSPPTIISLNLSSTGLNGEIAPSLANLMSIQLLDLSANNLTGTIPKFLGELLSLSYLNLTGNRLTGRIPSNLLERSKRGLLKLSVDDNPNPPTNDQDVKAMIDIKATYKVKRNWIGDPCLPVDYLWEGLTCTNSSPPTIISLNLSSTGLNGEIAPSLANLMSIQFLDLSANNLTGTIPKFLGELLSLSYLNLTGNHLTGRIPSNLLERSKRGLLKLSVDDNPNLDFFDPSNTRRRKIIIPVIASIASVIFLSLLIILWTSKWRKRDRVTKANKADGLIHTKDDILYSENGRFTYVEVIKMTNNFERTIGNGGFGIVYHGRVRNGTQVAVKMLSSQSVKSLSHRCQGLNEFQNEVQLLTRMHHKNVVPFIGYCKEGDNMALIYEYMAQGNLASHLSSTSNQSLTWGQRLRIALDVAQGLEYLHNYCKPPIIHRDMKATNILLNEKLEAKIGDFGMSKVFHKDDGQTHVSTAIKGTHGYLDPEYYSCNRLTEKSDIYSFGIVVLQLITGQPAIIQTSNSERINVTEWIRPSVAERNIQGMIDPRLEGDYDINSIWKVVDIALACILPRSIERPTSSDVVVELKECLETEIARERNRSINIEQEELSSSSYPSPR